MNFDNNTVLSEAREALSGKWTHAIIAILIIMALSLLGQLPRIGQLLSFLLAGPIAFGIARFFLDLARHVDEPKYERLFDGFKVFGNVLATYFLMAIIIIAYMLLLIVPGIIKGISYSMTFFILSDDVDMPPMDALRKSEAMMDGYKMQYFNLMLRFLLYSLACILTLGIGFFWLIPYAQTALARFYINLSQEEEDLDTTSLLVED